jgi:hypothetical protein
MVAKMERRGAAGCNEGRRSGIVVGLIAAQCDSRTLRLAGELDHGCATSIADMPVEHFHGERHHNHTCRHGMRVNGDARALRRRLASEKAGSGVPGERIEGMLIVGGEAAANAVQHGGGLGSARPGETSGPDAGPPGSSPRAWSSSPRPQAADDAALGLKRRRARW